MSSIKLRYEPLPNGSVHVDADAPCGKPWSGIATVDEPTAANPVLALKAPLGFNAVRMILEHFKPLAPSANVVAYLEQEVFRLEADLASRTGSQTATPTAFYIEGQLAALQLALRVLRGDADGTLRETGVHLC